MQLNSNRRAMLTRALFCNSTQTPADDEMSYQKLTTETFSNRKSYQNCSTLIPLHQQMFTLCLKLETMTTSR